MRVFCLIHFLSNKQCLFLCESVCACIHKHIISIYCRPKLIRVAEKKASTDNESNFLPSLSYRLSLLEANSLLNSLRARLKGICVGKTTVRPSLSMISIPISLPTLTIIQASNASCSSPSNGFVSWAHG